MIGKYESQTEEMRNSLAFRSITKLLKKKFPFIKEVKLNNDTAKFGYWYLDLFISLSDLTDYVRTKTGEEPDVTGLIKMSVGSQTPFLMLSSFFRNINRDIMIRIQDDITSTADTVGGNQMLMRDFPKFHNGRGSGFDNTHVDFYLID